MDTTEPTATTAAPDTSGGFIDSIDSFFDTQATAVEPTAPTEPATPTKPAEPATPTEPTATAEPDASKSTDALSDLDSLDSDPKDWTPQAARRFKELKAELKTYRTRAEELEQQVSTKDSRLQELEALANNPEYQALQERIAEYEQRMMVTQLEESYAYKTLVDEPLQTIVGEMDALATKYSIDTKALLDAVAESEESVQEERLSELLTEMSDRDKFRIYSAIDQINPLLQQRQVLQQHASEALLEAQQLEQQMREQSLREAAQQRQDAALSVADKLKSKLTFLTGMEGVDLNGLATEAAALDPASLDPVTGTYQAMAAKLLPKVAAQYVQLQRELETLTERLAEYDKATPKAGGGSLAAAGTPTTADGKSFLDAVTAAFGG